MSKFVKLKQGFDIKLAGAAEKKTADVGLSDTFAVKPTSFNGITRPKLLVNEGDTVKAGTPIFFDKMNDKVMHCAPVSGEVVEIKRGEKRKLLEIKILADKTIAYEEFPKHSASDIQGLSREQATDLMLKSGVWPNIIQRPFGMVADPEASPKAIFISAFDTHPLAADFDYILKGQEQYFQAGIDVLAKFTKGEIHLNLNADGEVSQLFSQAKNVTINTFSGPHPAGNVGVQIHHISPINKGETLWTVSPVGVAQIGKLFIEGKYDASRIIAVTGSEIKTPQYFKTITGACINKFVENNLKSDHVRYISGNVLTGERIAADGYLGYFDNQITVVPEGDYEEFLGWIKPSASKLSFHRTFGLLSFLSPNKERVVDTNTHGEKRAFVMTGAFEKVMPMDIMPMQLFKAILTEDFDAMEQLGIYEVIEEDVALCEFIDVSKHDLQAMLREGIELIQNS